MKNRRARLGTFPDGKVGLRVSALSFDAVTATDDGHAITFDSDWTDIARITAVGIANEVVVGVTSGINLFAVRATYPDLGFRPFVEVRQLSGSVVFDDFWNRASHPEVMPKWNRSRRQCWPAAVRRIPGCRRCSSSIESRCRQDEPPRQGRAARQ